MRRISHVTTSCDEQSLPSIADHKLMWLRTGLITADEGSVAHTISDDNFSLQYQVEAGVVILLPV